MLALGGPKSVSEVLALAFEEHPDLRSLVSRALAAYDDRDESTGRNRVKRILGELDKDSPTKLMGFDPSNMKALIMFLQRREATLQGDMASPEELAQRQAIARRLQYAVLRELVKARLIYDPYPRDHAMFGALGWMYFPDSYTEERASQARKLWHARCEDHDPPLLRHSIVLYEQLLGSPTHSDTLVGVRQELASLCISSGKYSEALGIANEMVKSTDELTVIQGHRLRGRALGYLCFRDEPAKLLEPFFSARRLLEASSIDNATKLLTLRAILRSILRTATLADASTFFSPTFRSKQWRKFFHRVCLDFQEVLDDSTRLRVPSGLDHDVLARSYASFGDSFRRARAHLNEASNLFEEQKKDRQLYYPAYGGRLQAFWTLGTEAHLQLIRARTALSDSNQDAFEGAVFDGNAFLERIVQLIKPENMHHSRFYYLGMKWTFADLGNAKSQFSR